MHTTQYARSGDVNIAYQVFGDGPDLVYVPGWVSNIEIMWDDPILASILRRLSTFSRVTIFDKRGTGMSDPVDPTDLPGLEQRMDDVHSVMEAAGIDRATLMGHSEGGNMAALFAATYPERTTGLILIGSYAKRTRSDDYPWAPTAESREEEARVTEETWGDPHLVPAYTLGSRADDPTFRDWVARYFRLGATPKAAATLLRMNTLMDTRSILPTIQVPTLCIYRTEDTDVRIEEGRWIASQIPNAKLVELPGDSHFFWIEDPTPKIDEIEEFITGHRETARPERALATVVFTDIVGSTEWAAELGDRGWRPLLERHNSIIRRQIERYRGQERGTAGDGFLATFDGPARGVRAARAIRDSVRPLGIEVRAGVHTGEVELVADDIAGMGVHIGARIASLAGPGQVFVSRTVRDLVVGSDLVFEERGAHPLKGVPGTWEIYEALG
ncbi:MAG TPA: adenylate/guanylate cyclase domain-containing protein [Acidimicrobiia bacterium]